MKWGSTKPGEVLTASKRWQTEIQGDRISIWLDGKPTVAANLAQLRTIRVSPGIMWATCHFDLLEGDSKHTLTVDGIPNDKAHEMKRIVAEATTATLATLVSVNTQSLELWLENVVELLQPEPDALVEDSDIAKAMSSVKPPASPGKIPWNSILWHEQADEARKQATKWPAWKDSPSGEVAKRMHGHNKNVFDAAVEGWVASATAPINWPRWIPKSAASKWAFKYPAPHWPSKLWQELWGKLSPEDVLRKHFNAHNDEHLSLQRTSRKQFFDTVEKNPLTDEQIHACVCMDDSVLVVAAAGSGKTSTMVAKSGYAIHEGLAIPEQILLLAFNVATASEVGKRILEQLKGVPDIEKVKSKTFHAFGIEVIAAATGKKPDLAPWVDPSKPGADMLEVSDIFRELSERDAGFKRDWDLFRTIYARDIGTWGEKQEPDAYGGGKRGFLTAKGDIVKSKEERIIANWLFYNGVNYEYERAYEHDTFDRHYRQYYPDFFYPDIDLYHEHFALNAKGEAPKDFRGYLQGVKWKRELHAEKGTQLIETTSHGISTGGAISHLEKELTARAITLAFDPNREALGLPPVKDQDLARSFRAFQQHVKNNGLTSAQLHAALVKQSASGYAARLTRFLSLYERIAGEWERRLLEGKCIDFEDMLLLAAGHVESGRFKSPYTIILADEFQDSSRARIRLLKALSKNPPVQTHLCVVGDDWQGINRFAGSDISVMTEFEETFENATTLTLNTTFRCPQHLCDVSSKFIQANPAQIAKTVRTTNPLTKTPLLAYGFRQKESIPKFVEEQLASMHGAVTERKLKPSKGTHITVMLLGRYRDDEPAALGQWKQSFGDRLKIEYKTAHGSKGLEAEYVFVLNVIEGARGFPSQMQDDPALQLAMPTPDPFSFAEERRLFYVAMTRARKQVRFYTTITQPSQFLLELVKNQHLTIENVDGEPMETCTKCGQGVLILREGPQGGAFHGCSRFPACDFTRNIDRQQAQATPTPARRSQRIHAPVKSGDQCPVCRRGVLQSKSGRTGTFLGCSSWPACNATASLN